MRIGGDISADFHLWSDTFAKEKVRASATGHSPVSRRIPPLRLVPAGVLERPALRTDAAFAAASDEWSLTAT
jgi:hypothetical protein